MEKILVIDSGTTNTKVFIYDRKLSLKEEASTPTEISFPQAGFVEQNAENWFGAVVKGVRKLKNKKGIEAISGSFQGATFVLLDKNLSPLRPAITWLDNRGEEFVPGFERRFGIHYFYKKTGHRILGWAPVVILKWIKKYQPEIWKKTARISFVSDYINFKLTGNFFLDPTSASMTTLFNIKKMEWDDELIEIAGIKKNMLPDVIKSYECGGKLKRDTADLLSLQSGIPVLAGGHDQYCASLGSGAFEKGKVLVSTGTAWAFLLKTDRIYYPDFSLSPGPHLYPGTYGLMGAISNGGIIYSWFMENFGTEKINLEKRPSEIIVIPHFSEKKGGFFNLSLSTKPSEILLATIEVVGFQLREIFEKAEKVIEKNRIKKIILIGGGAKNKITPQIVSDITKIMVEVPEIKEAAGRGAAILTLTEKDKKPSLSPLKGEIFRPDRKISLLYNEKYRKYLSLKNRILSHS